MWGVWPQRLEEEKRRNPRPDGFSNIDNWHNDMAKDMMSIPQELEAFGEEMPEAKYNKQANKSKDSQLDDCED